MPSARVGKDEINYAEQGDRGWPVVFVHGAASSHLIWWNQVRALAPYARALALDLPGHGRSSPGGRTTVAEYGDAVLRFMDALGLERAVVVGHSMGGAIAQTLALSHADRLAGLGLVGTGARLRVLPAILDGVLEDFERTVHLVSENCFAPGADAALRAKSEEEFRACPPAVTHGDYGACNTFDVMARIGEIRVPTLVVCGRQDQMTPVKYSEFLASKIRHAQLTLVDGAGHYVMVEKPDEVNRALVAFVTGLPR